MADKIKDEVPQYVEDLFNKFGFHQIPSSEYGVYVEWDNSKGVKVKYHVSAHPISTDDIINMVYAAGFNDGIYSQLIKIKHSLSEWISKEQVTPKQVTRADNNLLLSL